MSLPSALPASPALLMVSFDARRCGPARLPEGLAAAGFRVSALCTPEDPLAATRHLHRHFPLADTRSARHVAARLARALAATRPVLVIPCDERAVACLQALVRRGPRGDLDAGIIAPLVASLCAPPLVPHPLRQDGTTHEPKPAPPDRQPQQKQRLCASSLQPTWSFTVPRT